MRYTQAWKKTNHIPPFFFLSSALALRAESTSGARVLSGSDVCMKGCWITSVWVLGHWKDDTYHKKIVGACALIGVYLQREAKEVAENRRQRVFLLDLGRTIGSN